MGRPAPSWNHTFVKLPGDNRVYHAQGNFKSKFDLTADKLRDKTVLSFDVDEIMEIELAKGEQIIALTRKASTIEAADSKADQEKTPPEPAKTETTWENSEGKKADKPTVNTIVSALSNLSCESYIEDKEKGDFTKPVYTVRLKGSQEYILSLFEKPTEDAKEFPAISSESNYPFLLSEYQANRIMKSPDEMMKVK